MTDRRLASIVAGLPAEPRRGRPWSHPFRQRVLGACFGVWELHCAPDRLDVEPRLAALTASDPLHDRRASWVVEATLIPTRDQSHAVEVRQRNERPS